jgi:drug/metabolite transporter (DMT)-like permease
MTIRTTGQWLRLIGLLVEMIGVVGIVRERGGSSLPKVPLPGGQVISSAWIAVGLGFVIWLIASIILAATRPPREDNPQ